MEVPALPSHNTLREEVVCNTLNCPQFGRTHEVFYHKLGESGFHTRPLVFCNYCGHEARVLRGWKTRPLPETLK